MIIRDRENANKCKGYNDGTCRPPKKPVKNSQNRVRNALYSVIGE